MPVSRDTMTVHVLARESRGLDGGDSEVTFAPEGALAPHLVADLVAALHAANVDVRLTVPAPPGFDAAALGLERQPAMPLRSSDGRGLCPVTPWSGATPEGAPLTVLDWMPAGDSPAGTAAAMGFFARAVLHRLRLAGRPRGSVTLHCQGEWTSIVPSMLRLHHAEDRSLNHLHAVMALHAERIGEATHEPTALPAAGFSPDRFHPMAAFEYRGRLSFLKAALLHADAVTVPSVAGARQVLDSDLVASLGSLDAAAATRVHGIGVGLDTTAWDPSTDPLLARSFSAAAPGGKAECRAALLSLLHLTPPSSNLPVVAHFGPFTRDAGTDVVLAAAAALLAMGLRLVLVGKGDPDLETAARDLARERPGLVGVHVGGERTMLRRVLAGADAVLLPARQAAVATRLLVALRHGCPVLATPADGLADALRAESAGPAPCLALDEASAPAVVAGVRRLVQDWQGAEGAARRHAALGTDVGWAGPARRHVELIESLPRR